MQTIDELKEKITELKKEQEKIIAEIGKEEFEKMISSAKLSKYQIARCGEGDEK